MEYRRLTIESCKLISLRKIANRAGNIAVVENSNAPFEVKRIFYLYDVPGGESRGAHAHKNCHQFLVAVSGSYQVEITDGINTRIISLNNPSQGLLIPPGIWASEINFSTGSICLVLASHNYDEKDYIRNYDEYLKWKL